MRINSGRISQNVSTVKKSDFSKKQSPGVFYKKKKFFQNFANFAGKHCQPEGSVLFKKLAVLKAYLADYYPIF